MSGLPTGSTVSSPTNGEFFLRDRDEVDDSLLADVAREDRSPRLEWTK
jgi:hypothetical protein